MFRQFSRSIRNFHSFSPLRSTVGHQVLEQPYFSNVAYQVAPVEMTTLENGIRVVTEERRGETAAVGVFIKAGSRNETKENNGVAHFLEHMYFKVCSFFPYMYKLFLLIIHFTL